MKQNDSKKQQKPFFGISLAYYGAALLFFTGISGISQRVRFLGLYWHVGGTMLLFGLLLLILGVTFTVVAAVAARRTAIQRNADALKTAENSVPAEA